MLWSSPMEGQAGAFRFERQKTDELQRLKDAPPTQADLQVRRPSGVRGLMLQLLPHLAAPSGPAPSGMPAGAFPFLLHAPIGVVQGRRQDFWKC